MIPVLYRFTFNSPTGHVVAYLLALGIVAYTTWNGWRTAQGPWDDKLGGYREPTRAQRMERARLYVLYGLAIAGFGLWYALPDVPFIGKGKGEGIPLHTYGILIGIGFLGAVGTSAYLAEREWLGDKGKKMREQIFDLAFYVFVGGIGGAVLLFNIVNIKDVFADGGIHPQMGMVFQGGLVCAAGVAYWYGKKHDIDFLRLSDIALPTVSLGSAFGRLGCFSAGCCWGKVRSPDALLAVKFPGAHVKDLIGTETGQGVASAAYSSMADHVHETRWVVESTGQVFKDAVPGAVRISDWVAQHGHTLPIHPTQLYEAAVQFLLFALFISLRPFRRFHGQIAGIWLMVYSVERSTVELFRGDGERGTIHGWFDFIPRDAWWNISTSQFGSLCIFSLGAWLLYTQWRKYAARPKLELPAADARSATA